MPHNTNQQPDTNLNQISLTWPESTVGSSCLLCIWLIYIGNFQNTQIIHATYKTTNQSDGYQGIHIITQTIPEQAKFTKETLYRRKSLKAQHCHSPSLRLSSRNLVQISQIPYILRSGNINTSVSLNVLCVRLCTVKRPHNQRPNYHGANNVKKEMYPKPLSKQSSIRQTERHQQQSHITYTRESQQTFQCRLSQWGKHPNNKASPPKELQQSATKTNRPNVMKASCPEKQNLNFRQSTNHQGYTAPSPHINVRRPHMQRSLSQLPQQSQTNQPHTQHSQQICCWTLCVRKQNSQKLLNRAEISVSCFTINQSHTQQHQATAKCPQQKVFHTCFNCIRRCIVHPTQYNNTETLKFQTNIQPH